MHTEISFFVSQCVPYKVVRAAVEYDIVQKIRVMFSNGFDRDATLSRLLVHSLCCGSSLQVWLCVCIEDLNIA
jgi:hypothetical protein